MRIATFLVTSHQARGVGGIDRYRKTVEELNTEVKTFCYDAGKKRNDRVLLRFHTIQF